MIRVAVTGPESSGKTTLASQLARHYDACLVTEYAREYLTELGRDYNKNDLDFISRKQLENESSAVKTGKPVIIFDTDIIVLKIWYEHKFGEVPEWLTSEISTRRYDLHLLTAPDVPYEPDPLRENPGKGQYFFQLFKSELESHGFDYRIINGRPDQRLIKAKKAIDNIDQ